MSPKIEEEIVEAIKKVYDLHTKEKGRGGKPEILN